MSSIGFEDLGTSVNIANAVSPQDGLADTILGLLWVGAFYVIGSMWSPYLMNDCLCAAEVML